MNEFDQFVKHGLKIKYYIRYVDDFIILHYNKSTLLDNIRYIICYLNNHLKLSLHPDKVFIKTFASGVDFLGWVNFAKHRILRTATKRRMLKNLGDNPSKETQTSYLGMLKWGNAEKLRNQILSMLK